MITIKDKKDCCGCTACYNAGPKKAIEMQADQEGFLYPVIDREKCVDCGICDSTCPIINKVEKNPEQTKGYILRIKNNNVLFESTSGGGFTALAEYVLHNGGVVYGTGYDEMMNVICKRATTTAQLQEMRGSKFVQSTLGNTFERIKKELLDGVYVMFTGSPCQIAGLLHYLKKKPENLLCVDFVCRGVPSPGLWRNYVNFMEEKFKIGRASCRERV